MLGKQVLQLERKCIEVNFRVLQETAKEMFLSENKNVDKLFG